MVQHQLSGGLRRPGPPCMLLTLQCQPWGECPTLGGKGSGSSSMPPRGSGTVCLSSCWLSAPSAGPSPEDGLRHRDAAVCLHLGSGSPSLHVVVTP